MASNAAKCTRQRELWVFGLVVVCMLCLASGSTADDAPQPLSRAGRSLAEYQPSSGESVSEPLLVTLLDGKIVAVEEASGQVLWTFDSGSPLVSVKQTQAVAPGVNIFPGVDGGLYAYGAALSVDGGVEGSKLERLPISLPELVDASPSLTDDGSVILGKRLTRVYVLDKSTGSLLQLISDVAVADGSPTLDGMPVLQMLDPDRTIVVGREDFVVRSVQVTTGLETWNATYGRMVNLRPSGGRHGFGSGLPSGSPADTEPEGLPLFTVGSDQHHTLQAVEPSTRVRRWAITFDTPPVGVFTASDSTNHLDPVVRNARMRPPPLAVRPNAPAIAGVPPGAAPVVPPGSFASAAMRVLVGHLRGGGLYALPADHVVLDDALVPRPWHALAIGPSAAPPMRGGAPNALPPSSLEQQRDPAASPDPDAAYGKALAVIRPGQDVVTLMTDSDGSDGVVSGLVCPPGLHLVEAVEAAAGHHSQRPWLPDASKVKPPAPEPPAPPQPAGMSSRAVLVVAVLGSLGMAVSAMVLMYALWRSSRVGHLAAKRQALRSGMMGREGEALGEDDCDDESEAEHSGNGAANGVSTGPGSGSRSRGALKVARPLAGVRRRKGKPVVAIAADGSTDRLPMIDEDQQLQAEAAAALPPSLLPGALGSMDSAAAAQQFSADARVQHNPDGSLSIGRLVVGPSVLGYGSAGTIVYEGVMDGRPVAVKRLLRQFTELARKEIEVLILSDEHPNVVRCFAMEEDREFVYLALERCRSTLNDFLAAPAGRASFLEGSTQLPTQRCIDTMLDICRGLAALHERGIVHRDLKPHNVLMAESSQRAKLSDMGLSKQLVAEQSSFESHGAGGSSGWQAPEQLIARDGGAARQTRSMDVFSLGCILYYCITGGRHPFGDSYERDTNILNGAPALGPLAAQPEAVNLVATCLAKDPARRPSVQAVLGHPMWWTEERRLAFLVDISDRVESEDREPDTTLLAALEACACVALAGPSSCTPAAAAAAAVYAHSSLRPGGSADASGAAPSAGAEEVCSVAAPVPAGSGAAPNWGASLPAELVANLGRYRRYDYTSLRDLLRVVRNKRNHFREMPQPLQVVMGPLPGGFLRFFSQRFPHLLMAVYSFALQHLQDEALLEQYWPGGPAGREPFVQSFLTQHATTLQAAVRRMPSVAAPVVPPPPEVGSVPGPNPAPLPITPSKAARSAEVRTMSPSPPPPPPRGMDPAAEDTAVAAVPGDAGCIGPPSAKPLPILAPPIMAIVGYEPADDNGEFYIQEFPRRAGKQLCDFYAKTGHCKFGDGCVFDHPDEYAVKITRLGLPLRPDQPLCSFYLKHNECRFGPSCKFHHPILKPIFAGTSAIPAPMLP